MAKSDSTGLILLAVGGAAAYYAYTQGWLCSFGLGPSCPAAAAPVPAPVPTYSTAPVAPPVATAPLPAAIPQPAPPLAASQAILLSALQAVASQPGNVALSTSGGQTYSGWQWDAIAKAALGPGYQPLSGLPTLQGGTQYTIQQYLAAYPSTGGVSGLGRFVFVRDRWHRPFVRRVA